MKLMELYQNRIWGAIKGLDRIRFRGTLRLLANQSGLKSFMSYASVLFKDFSGWAEGLTAMIRQSGQAKAEAMGIEMRYLSRAGLDKEKLAREIAWSRGITEGSICMFSVVEPCMAPMVKGNKAQKTLDLVMAQRKCIFLYHYFEDPELGFGHVRIQSWLPLNVFVCLNGRHWLERQLQKQGIDYAKDGNGFPWIEDLEAAQAILDGQLRTDGGKMLNRLALGSCPALSQVLRPLKPHYYWSADETEWATDILFRSVKDLDALYPDLLYHALKVSDSPSVMKYMGRRCLSRAGRVKARAPQEVISDYRKLYEGVRIKHWVNHNSVKMYNKGGSILRIETTINDARDCKVFRHPEDDARRRPSWRKMRKGVSDLYRRCQISDACNERYAEALASAQAKENLKEVAWPACNRITKKGKTYRGLNPWQQKDYPVLAFLARGEHALRGFRNSDLRKWLYPESERMEKSKQKKYSGRTTRWIKLLRVHGLVKKVAKENRYLLTSKGQKLATALLAASAVDIKGLTNLVA